MIQAKADGGGEQWNLNARCKIRLGDNSINGKGSLQQKLAGQIDIKLPRLAQLSAATARPTQWAASMSPVRSRRRKASSGLQGTQLAFDDNRLQSLNLDATLDSAQRAKIDL